MTRSANLGLLPVGMFLLIVMTMVVVALSGPVFVEEAAKVELPAAMQQSVQQAALEVLHEQSVTVPEWIAGRQIGIPPGYVINGHATKHQGEALDAWKIYTLILEGHCVASTVWCGRDMEKLYLCVSPSGLVGGMFVLGDEIMSGFGARESYWESRLESDSWGVCDD